MTIYAHQPTWSDEEVTFWIKLWADLTDPRVGFSWEWRVGDRAWLPSQKVQVICVVASHEEVRFVSMEAGEGVKTFSSLQPRWDREVWPPFEPIPLPSYDVIVAMEKNEAANPYFYHAIEIEDSKDSVYSWMPFWRSSIRPWQYLSKRL